MPDTIDIAALIDSRPFGRFHLSLLVLSFLLTLIDGYDVISVAYAAPLLVREWHLAPASLGPLFGSGLFGGLFGPLLFGYAADRLGRKNTTIAGAVFFGLFTLLQVWAHSLEQLMALRFIAGIGVSGTIPMVLALNSEYAPKRMRGTITALSFLGLAVGGAVAGLVAVVFMGVYGWQILFWTGGIAPIALALLGYFLFPESAKFLSLRPKRRAELLATLRRLDPQALIPADAHFVIGDETNAEKIAFRELFRGRLARVTPLLWLLTLIWLMVFFFVNQWTPALMAARGFPISVASWGTTLFQIGCICGGLLIMRPLDRWGYAPITVMCALTIPVIVAMGLPDLPQNAVLSLAFLAGVGLAAMQFGTFAVETQVYPTFVRALGVGTCVAAGRGGSVLGPIVGGILLGLNLPVSQLFGVAAGALGIGLVASLAFTPLYRARLLEMAGGERAALTTPV